ncbi:MAG TPA: CCA tRNA nucleotidyltransferase [Planctomycetes bacterium]|nr:CCA tRNA nucleotidyltransferase [Planctomycetota bacterium]
MTNRTAAIRIIKRLRKAGYEALLAGGCVRDMLLNRPAKDYDVATDARPDEIVKLFRRTLKVGAKFGVIMVIDGGKQTEVATFRTESGYTDGRHPQQVAFCSPRQDAGRRDFTINGMFYDPLERKVIDYVKGLGDLRKGLVRAIGDAQKRFSEDYLRLLRAVRFATQLGFTIEPKTWSAVCSKARNITKISAERIAMELEMILTHPGRRDGASMLLDSGLTGAIFAGVGAKEARFGIEVLGRLRKKVDFPLALASFFAAFGTKPAMAHARRLKPSRAHNRHLRFLLEGRGKLLESDMGLAQLKLLLAEPYFSDLYEFQRAIQKARGEGIGPLLTVKKRARALKGSKLTPRPLLDGHQLIALGVQPGPMVGLVAQEMYIAQLAEELSTPDQAGRWVAQWLKQHK